jgi:hypothetical protein
MPAFVSATVKRYIESGLKTAKLALMVSILTALTALLSAGVAAQDRLAPDRPGLLDPRADAEVVYTITGRIDPKPSTVRALVEIEFPNPDEIAHDRALFALPDTGQVIITFDSVLYRGVPIDGESIQRRSDTLAVSLPQPLRPAERGFLMFFVNGDFSEKAGRRSDPTVLSDWFPRYLALPGQKNRSETGLEAPPTEGSFRVLMTVDSAYHLIGPGVLINEREQFGLLPLRKGLYEEVLKEPLAADGVSEYRPVFAGGERTFAWVLAKDDRFPLAIIKQPRLDRVIVDSLIVDVFSSRSAASGTIRNISSVAHKIALGAKNVLGDLPDRHQLIVLGGNNNYSAPGFLSLADAGLPSQAGCGLMRQLVREFVGLLSEPYAELTLDGTLLPYLIARILCEAGLSPECRDFAGQKEREVIRRLALLGSFPGSDLDSMFGVGLSKDSLQPLDLSGLPTESRDAIEGWLTIWSQPEWRVDIDRPTVALSGNRPFWMIELRAQIRSPYPIPLQVKVYPEKGETILKTVIAGEGTILLGVPGLSVRPVAVQLDPHGVLPLTDHRGHFIRLDNCARMRLLSEPADDPLCGLLRR